jgi:hypothetical protein
MLVWALLAELAVEAFDVAVLHLRPSVMECSVTWFS